MVDLMLKTTEDNLRFFKSYNGLSISTTLYLEYLSISNKVSCDKAI